MKKVTLVVVLITLSISNSFAQKLYKDSIYMESIYQMTLFGDYNKTISLIEEYLSIETDQERKNSAHVIAGEAYVQLKQFSKAVSEFSIFLNRTKYLELALKDPTNKKGILFQVVKALVGRGMSKAFLGDFRGAIGDMDEGIELIELGLKTEGNRDTHFFKKKETAHFIRGTARVSLGTNMEGACNDFSISGEFGNEQAYELINTYCR